MMKEFPRISSVSISGYRPFGEFHADLGALEVIVGANGSGKSSLLEFLQVLHDGTSTDLPAGLIANGSGRTVYHRGRALRENRISCDITTSGLAEGALRYSVHLSGQFGNQVAGEDVWEQRGGEGAEYRLLHRSEKGMAVNRTGVDDELVWVGGRMDPEFLGLPRLRFGDPASLAALQQHLFGWRFYSTYAIDADRLRQPVITQQRPFLEEDASNLSDVLLHLSNEHRKTFDELNATMRLLVPGFRELKVRSYGAPGHVMAFWREEGSDQDLSLADLSDGIFRLLCWVVICIDPNPPTLICVDEPDQGVHPRTLPVLAALFKEASERTQVILTTHNSYFLSQFALEDIAVMRKENGEAKFIKPKDSKTLVAILQEFGDHEIELLHRSEELEQLP
ncbi:MAG TPA: AAA family ATPase [Candidatus Kapabacteria bacterium]|nr:AAA family ATPase [Candidatus Kapabacteria bacterium]